MRACSPFSVVLEVIQGDALKNNLFIVRNKHGQIEDFHNMPLNVLVVVVDASYKLPTLLSKFYLVLDVLFQILVAEAVLH